MGKRNACTPLSTPWLKARRRRPYAWNPSGDGPHTTSSDEQVPYGVVSTWCKCFAHLQVIHGRAWMYTVVFEALSEVWLIEMVIPFDRTILHRQERYLHTVWTFRPARQVPRFYPRLIPPGVYNVTLSARYFCDSDGVFHDDLV